MYTYIIYNACVTLWIPVWWHVRLPLCKVCQEESSWFGIDFSHVWRLATIWWNFTQRKRFHQFGLHDQSANFKGTTVSPFWNKDLQGLMIEWYTSIVATQGVAAHWSNDGMSKFTCRGRSWSCKSATELRFGIRGWFNMDRMGKNTSHVCACF